MASAAFGLVLAPTPAADYESPYCEWRGQAQYQAIIKRESDPAAHAVVPLVVDIDPQSKVIGASTENGCRLLGIAKPGVTAQIVTLNVTLRSSNYPGFNRVYRGYLSVFTAKKYASLTLQAIDVSSATGGGTFNIESTMRR